MRRKLINLEIAHEGLYEDIPENLIEQWMPYVANEIIASAFVYAIYTMHIAKLTGVRMKEFLSLSVLRWIFFRSIRSKDGEPKYTHKDKSLRHFVR